MISLGLSLIVRIDLDSIDFGVPAALAERFAPHRLEQAEQTELNKRPVHPFILAVLKAKIKI